MIFSDCGPSCACSDCSPGGKSAVNGFGAFGLPTTAMIGCGPPGELVPPYNVNVEWRGKPWPWTCESSIYNTPPGCSSALEKIIDSVGKTVVGVAIPAVGAAMAIGGALTQAAPGSLVRDPFTGFLYRVVNGKAIQGSGGCSSMPFDLPRVLAEEELVWKNFVDAEEDARLEADSIARARAAADMWPPERWVAVKKQIDDAKTAIAVYNKRATDALAAQTRAEALRANDTAELNRLVALRTGRPPAPVAGTLGPTPSALVTSTLPPTTLPLTTLPPNTLPPSTSLLSSGINISPTVALLALGALVLLRGRG